MNLVLPTSRNHARILQPIPMTMSLSTKRPKVWTCLNQMDVADVAQEAQEHLMPYFSTQHKYLRYLAIVFLKSSDLEATVSVTIPFSDEMWWNARQQLSVLYPTRRWCLREHAADISTNRHEGRGTHGDVEVLDMLRHSESRGFDIQIDRARNTKAHEAASLPNLAKSCQILAKFRRIALRLAWKWSWVASNIATRWIMTCWNMDLGFWHVPWVLWRWLDKFLSLIISWIYIYIHIHTHTHDIHNIYIYMIC